MAKKLIPIALPTQPEPDAHKMGYARVSTSDQNPQLQIDALLRAGVDPRDIWVEKVSGAALKRPILEAMMRDIMPGDIVMAWKMDRLGRNAMHLLQIAQEIQGKGAHLRLLDNTGLDTTTAAGRVMFGLLAHMAQFERDLIYERTMAGLEAARAKGRYGGRQQRFTDEQVLEALEKHGGNLTQAAASLKYKFKGKMRGMSLEGFKKALARAQEAAQAKESDDGDTRRS